MSTVFYPLLVLIAAGYVKAHACNWLYIFLFYRWIYVIAAVFHPSMYGFNVTAQTFPYDNRPVAPLVDMTFDQWWFHGHLGHPPNPGDLFELPAGKPATTEIACDKGATSFFQSSPGGDVRQGNNVCPNSPLAAIHSGSILHYIYARALIFITATVSFISRFP